MKTRFGRVCIVFVFVAFHAVFVSGSATDGVSRPNKDATSGDIRLGVISPITGAVPSFGEEVKNGVLLAVQEWNNRGGIDGRRILAFVEDGQCNAEPAVEAAERLINQYRVHYLIGEVCSKASIPVSEITNAAKVIQVTPTSTNPSVTVGTTRAVKPYVFRNCFIDSYQGVITAKFAYHSLGARTAYVMGDNSNDYVRGIAESFTTAFTGLGGIVIGSAYYDGDADSDFSRILAEIKAARPDIICLPDYYNVVNLVLKQARAMGIGVPFIGGDGWDSQDLDLAAAEGSYFSNHFSDKDPRPEVSLFLDVYDKSFPSAQPVVGIKHMIAALAYDAAYMVFRAIAEAGADDTTQVAKVLESMDFHGVSGDITFDKSHNPLKTGYMFTVRNRTVQFAARVDP